MSIRHDKPRDNVVRTGNRIYELSMLSVTGSEPGRDHDFLSRYIHILEELKTQASWFEHSDRCQCEGLTRRRRQCLYSAPEYYEDPKQEGHFYRYFVGQDFHVKCPERMEVSQAVMLGKGDVCLFTHGSDELWSCHLRSQLHQVEGVREIFPVPCLRMVSTEDIGPFVERHEKGRRISDRSMFKRGSEQGYEPAPVICFTAAQLRGDGQGPQARQLNPERIRDLAKTVLELKHMNLEKALSLTCDPRIEAFFTFSDYQLLLKYEAASFTEACTVLKKIREKCGKLIHSTSTQVALPFTEPKEIRGWHEHETEPEFSVGLLLRVETDKHDAIVDYVRAAMEKWREDNHLIGKPRQDLIRHGYWDIHIVTPCNSLHRFAHFIVDKVAGLDGIEATRIVPYQELEGTPELKPRARPKRFKPLPSLPPVGAKLKPRQADDDTWFRRRAQDLVVHLGWVKTRIDQFRQAWTRSDRLPETKTIDRLQDILSLQHKNLAMALEDGSNDYPELLEAMCEARGLSSKCLESFEALVALYHERLEGAHLGAVVEPYSRLGEHAGVLALTLNAIDRLISDYCNTRDGEKVWDGLVTTTTGKDFSIVPHLHLLLAPVPIKLSARSNILTIPHEASHLLFHELGYSRQRLTVFGKDIRGQRIHEIHEDTGRLTAVAFEKCLEDVLSKLPIDEDKAKILFGNVNPLFMARKDDINDEVMADIVAYLIGGPVFAVGFNSYTFDSCPAIPWEGGSDETTGHRPLMFLPSTRVGMGQWIGKLRNWDARWLDLIARLEQRMSEVDETAWERLQCNVAWDRLNNNIDAQPAYYCLLQQALRKALHKVIDDQEANIVGRCPELLTAIFGSSEHPICYDDQEPDSGAHFERIVSIANRLHYDWEMVLDVPPRDLASASALLQRYKPLSDIIDRWSTYPTLRLYLSMAYSRV